MPSWTRQGTPLDHYRMFNARSETVEEKGGSLLLHHDPFHSVKGTWHPHYFGMDRCIAFAVPCMFDTSSESVEEKGGALLV